MANLTFKNKNLSNLIWRCITSLILAPVVLLATHKGGLSFSIMIIICAILMAFEWHALISKQGKVKWIWILCGVGYIALPCISLLWLRGHPKGFLLVTFLFSTVWATDIGAYFAGRIIGGWKIMPSISPNKTWAGLAGGAICAAIVGYYFAQFLQSSSPRILITICVTLAVYAQIGDFIESALKRKFNAKDSSNLLPGHGGILDRVDGIVTTAPKLAIGVLLDKWGIFS